MPDDFVLEALTLLNETYSLDGHILRRRRAAGDSGEQLSAVEVARRFGGSIIEEVEEFGSQDVSQWEKVRR